MLIRLGRYLAGQRGPARRAYDPRRPLCFMHIPKACGTSLAASLGAALSPAIAVGGWDRVLFGGFTDFDSLDQTLRVQIVDTPGALPRDAQFVAGHFSYATLRHAYPDAQVVTLLREPATRLMSLWMFWRRHNDAHLAGWGSWAASVRHARRGLAEFLGETTLAAQIDNVALRMLLWPHTLIPDCGFIDPAHDRILLRLARARLAGFAFAGITEAPDTWNRLGAWLGRPLATHRMNAADTIPPALQVPLAEQLDAHCLGLLDARSRLDLPLWQAFARAATHRPETLRQQTILQHVARYSALMAA